MAIMRIKSFKIFFMMIFTLIGSCLQLPIEDGATESVSLEHKLSIDQSDKSESPQLPLNFLIGKVEQNLLESAVSVGHLAYQNDSSVPSVTPKAGRLLQKRNTDGDTTKEVESTTEANIILQTTKKVTSKVGSPAHILIDRISIQPNDGNISFIPVFQLKSKSVEKSESKPTTETQSSPAVKIDVQISSTTPSSNTDSLNENSSEEDILKSTTDSIKKADKSIETIEKLKDAEKKLKEKVAEIEAEPIILSSRI